VATLFFPFKKAENGMHPIEIVILLLTVVVALAMVARRVNIPFPIMLTLAGLGIGLVPGLPTFALEPSLVLLVFLPPILYSAAWYTSWRHFKANLEPISVLAVGLVIATSLAVAFAAHWMIPGMSLAEGFLLGAIISPPDAVAATAIMRTVRVPKKVVTILEGESLVNDATALVAFKFALAAVATGHFSLPEASGRFVLVALGGVAMGLLIGWASSEMHKRSQVTPAVETVMTFITAYAAFIAAEKLHVSGVLSVVAAGLLMGNRQSRIHSSKMRLQAIAVWEFAIVLLDGLIFILIGLQLPLIMAGIREFSGAELATYGLVISIVAVLIRMAYIYIADFVSARIRRRLGVPPVFSSLKHTTVLAYTGMRGIVSLAAALAIPVLDDAGQPFPHRDLILFITFCVILFTLIVQGLSLPLLIRRLRFAPEEPDSALEYRARKTINQAALARINALIERDNIGHQLAHQIRNWHDEKAKYYDDRASGTNLHAPAPNALLLEAIAVQRQALLGLKDSREIDETLFRTIEHELDLEEARLIKSTHQH
jgi:CPA1 family monovalent cation:H+ antiporter